MKEMNVLSVYYKDMLTNKDEWDIYKEVEEK